MATLVMTCSSFEFFSVTVNGFANSLSQLSTVPWNKHYGDHVLNYLLRVVGSLPSARWSESQDGKERTHGPMSERLAHRLSLLLLSLATLDPATVGQKVCAGLSTALQQYSSLLADAERADAGSSHRESELGTTHHCLCHTRKSCRQEWQGVCRRRSGPD